MEGVDGRGGGVGGGAVGFDAEDGFGGFGVEENGDEVGEGFFVFDGRELVAGNAVALGAGEGADGGVGALDGEGFAEDAFHVVEAGLAVAIGEVAVVEGLLLNGGAAGGRGVERIEAGGQLDGGEQEIGEGSERVGGLGDAAAGEVAVGLLEERAQLGAALAGDVLKVAEAGERTAGEIGGAAVDLVGHGEDAFEQVGEVVERLVDVGARGRGIESRVSAQHFGLHGGKCAGVVGEALVDAGDGLGKAQRQAGADERGVARGGDLLAVFVEHVGEVATQGFLLHLEAGEALDGFLHGAQFVESFAGVGEAGFDGFPRALAEFAFVGEHGADAGEFVGEDGGVGPGDFPQRCEHDAAVGVEVDVAAPIAAGRFIEPSAFEQVLEDGAGLGAGVLFPGGGIGAVEIGVPIEIRVGLEGFDDDGHGFLAGDAVGAVGRFVVEAVEHIDIERGVFSGQHAEESRATGFAEQGGGQVLGGHAQGWQGKYAVKSMLAWQRAIFGFATAGRAASFTAARAQHPRGRYFIMWKGRFTQDTSSLVEQFGESISYDWRLFPHDIAGSIAHARAQHVAGLLTAEEFAAIEGGLRDIEGDIRDGKFEFRTSLEDIHMNIEAELTRRIGPAGGKLHTARSRNDQVATDTRLYCRAAIDSLTTGITGLQQAMLGRAGAHAATIIPGYTHLQRGQPVTVGHHFLAYVEMLERDKSRMVDCRRRLNVSPLGSGALAGSTINLDRHAIAAELGFDAVTTNSMDAIADRDYIAELLFAIALCGAHLSRLSEDLILWCSAEFGFAVLSDAHTTGSSLMPQKKNPDVCELTRGKTGRLTGNLMNLLVALKGLPLTYNRDLQEDKPPLFDSVDTLALVLAVNSEMIAALEMRDAACRAAASDPMLLATDLADHLVKSGVPFRSAHDLVGKAVAEALRTGTPLDQLDLAAVDPAFDEASAEVFHLDRALAARTNPGSPAVENVRNEINRWKARLAGQS